MYGLPEFTHRGEIFGSRDRTGNFLVKPPANSNGQKPAILRDSKGFDYRRGEIIEYTPTRIDRSLDRFDVTSFFLWSPDNRKIVEETVDLVLHDTHFGYQLVVGVWRRDGNVARRLNDWRKHTSWFDYSNGRLGRNYTFIRDIGTGRTAATLLDIDPSLVHAEHFPANPSDPYSPASGAGSLLQHCSGPAGDAQRLRLEGVINRAIKNLQR